MESQSVPPGLVAALDQEHARQRNIAASLKERMVAIQIAEGALKTAEILRTAALTNAHVAAGLTLGALLAPGQRRRLLSATGGLLAASFVTAAASAFAARVADALVAEEEEKLKAHDE